MNRTYPSVHQKTPLWIDILIVLLGVTGAILVFMTILWNDILRLQADHMLIAGWTIAGVSALKGKSHTQ